MSGVGGRYRLVERLGAGGMSVVWRGYDEVLGRQVAVKVLAPSLAADRVFRARIRTEAQAAARLSHPHITNVYDYGESGGVPYVVMELVDGVPLAACATPMPWRDAVAICAEVASALAAAHARGVVHRDVTPGNVMLTAVGAKVLDFGISAVVGEQETGPDGSLLGTPAYIAPERLDGGQVSAAADVYGLGLLLYRCLTGRLPWPGRSRAELLRSHLYADPEPLPDLDGLPAEVADLCMRCLAKAPDERPTSADVVEALAGAGGHVPRPVSPAPAGGAAATGGTTILPRTDDPTADAARGVVPAAGIQTGAVRPPLRDLLAGRRRQVLSTAAAVVVLGAAGIGFAAAGGGDPAGTTTTALAAPAPAADKPACEVRYALRRDSGRAFDADLTVVNAGRAPVTDWSLAFSFPGDQRLTRAGSATVEQRGSAVVLRPAGAAAVPAGGSAGIRLTGSYAKSNAFPVEFRLDGAFCAPKLSTVTTTSTPTTRTQPAGEPVAAKPKPKPKPPKPEKADDDSSGPGGGKGKGKGKGGGDD